LEGRIIVLVVNDPNITTNVGH